MTTRTLAAALCLSPILMLGVAVSSEAATGSAKSRPASPISPGEIEQESEASGSCPTFSWSPASEASGTEIAVYELREEGGRAEPLLLFSRRFPEGASSWSPARAECLQPGGRFAWIVRSASADGAEAGAWSEARRFTVAGAPGDDEVAAALEVLRRRFEAGGATVQATGGAGGGSSAHHPAAAARRQGSSARAPEGVAGSAAIRGELAGASGETYGVLGVSNSAAGAGLAATNNANGPDLRIDGSAAGATDLALSEAALDRSSLGSETFTIQNSGGGTMTLKVDNADVITTTTLTWAAIAGVPAGFADGIDDDTLYAAGNQLDLATGTFGVLEGPGSGLDADTLDGLDSADVVTTSSLTWVAIRRKFYLTTGTFTGSQPLAAPACVGGYHMAALYEIWDVSNLVYDQALGSTAADAGSGPPSGVRGWVRTGTSSSSVTGVAGVDNCNVWTVNTGSGTSALLAVDWSAYSNDDGITEPVPKLSHWVAAALSCSTPRAVWCVED